MPCVFGFRAGWTTTLERGLDIGKARLRHTLTTVLCEKSHEIRHRFEIRRVINELLLLTRRDEACTRKLLQMKRQSGPGDFERFADAAGRNPFRSCLDQQAKDRKAGFLSERGKSRYGCFNFHVSSCIEIVKLFNPPVFCVWSYPHFLRRRRCLYAPLGSCCVRSESGFRVCSRWSSVRLAVSTAVHFERGPLMQTS